MASPQTENGYTPIANELLERVYSAPFYGSQLKIILLIFRYTYGFSRKSHSLSISFIHKALGGDKRTIQRELQNLIDKNVISVISEPSFNSSRELAVNKDYEAWHIPFTQLVGSNPADGVQPTTTDGVQPTTTDGVQPTQENNNKTKRKQDVQFFFETVWKLYPEKKGKLRVSEKSKNTLYKLGFETVKKCIDRYIENKPDWQNFQNGSTFFNSGYLDYLDENFNVGNKVKKEFVPISDKPEDWSGF